MTLPATDAWCGAAVVLDEGQCPTCHRDACEGACGPEEERPATGPDDGPCSDALPDFLTTHHTDVARDLLVGPLLARGETALLHGPPRALKTWSALEMAIAATTGTSAFGVLEVPAEARVLYVTNEDRAATVADRLRGLLAGKGFTAAPSGFRLLVGAGVSLDDPVWRERLIDEALRWDIDLVTFDPLRSVTAAVDQGPKEVQPLGQYLRRLIRETGCGVLAVHHDTKPQAGIHETRRRAQRASGGGLFSHMDAPIHAGDAGDGQTLLAPDGFKFSDDPAALLVRLVVDSDQYRLTADPTSVKTPDDIELHAAITDHLRSSGGGSTRAIAKAAATDRRTVTDALHALKGAGTVDMVIGARKAQLWHLVD